MARRVRIVGDHHDRLSELLDRTLQEVEELARRATVEVSGRFVGEDDLRSSRQRSSDCHPLLLAPGELSRVVVEAMS